LFLKSQNNKYNICDMNQAQFKYISLLKQQKHLMFSDSKCYFYLKWKTNWQDY